MDDRIAQIARCKVLIASGELRLGMSRDEVKKLLGQPDDMGGIGRNGVAGIFKFGYLEFGFGKRAKDGLHFIYAEESETEEFVSLLRGNSFESKHCCEMMAQNVNFRCDRHPDIFDCPDNLILFSAESKKYGIIIHDGGNSSIGIQYCPWCGKKLNLCKRG